MTYNPRCRLVSGALEEDEEGEEEGGEHSYGRFNVRPTGFHPPDVTYRKKNRNESCYLSVARWQIERTLAAAAESEPISP